MGISFLGHTSNYEIWVFNLDGNRFVARNFSTQTPLRLKFAGVFDTAPLAEPLVKTSGFDITESSSRLAIFTWGGNLYTATWDLDDEDRDDDAGTRDGVLNFGAPIPYVGPPVAPVGSSGVTNTQSPPPAAIPTIVPSLPIDQNTNIMGGGQDQVRSPVIPPTAVTSAPVTGTDWVKLGIQLGVAYFILS
jgi:hypothetical protein